MSDVYACVCKRGEKEELHNLMTKIPPIAKISIYSIIVDLLECMPNLVFVFRPYQGIVALRSGPSLNIFSRQKE